MINISPSISWRQTSDHLILHKPLSKFCILNHSLDHKYEIYLHILIVKQYFYELQENIRKKIQLK